MNIPKGTMLHEKEVIKVTIGPTKWGLRWKAWFNKKGTACCYPCAEGWPNRDAALANFWENVAGELKIPLDKPIL